MKILTMHHIIVFSMLMLIGTISHAQRPDAPPYAERGSYAVGTIDVDLEDGNRTLEATVWYPADETTDAEATVTYPLVLVASVQGIAVRDANIADGTFPVIVFSHGSGGSKVLGLWMTEHLASHGFIVIAMNHAGNDVQATLDGEQDFATNYAQRPIDVLRAIDWLEEQNQVHPLLAGHIDTATVGVVGHSFGGYTALSAGGSQINMDALGSWCTMAQETDAINNNIAEGVCFLLEIADDIAKSRGYSDVPSGAWDMTHNEAIQAVVALAPWNGPILSHEQNDTPTLFIVGEADTVTPPERDAYMMYDAMTQAERWLISLALGDHYLFVDSCPPALLVFGAFDSCSDDVWDIQRAHDLSNHYMTAFLLHYLQGDDEALNVFAEDIPRGLSLRHDAP
jgi:predicted dienelactone hydrolase